MKRIWLIVVIVVTMAGCASVGKDIDHDRASKVNQIQEGSTTKQQVYDLLGKPDSATNMAAGDSYWSYDIKTAKPIVDTFAGVNNIQSQYLMIIFGREGIVKKIIGKNSDSALGVNTGGKGYMPDMEENKRPR
jgi:outer membrane protein assembly factor BamE (lipoprotein component of BamABCDE complex)